MQWLVTGGGGGVVARGVRGMGAAAVLSGIARLPESQCGAAAARVGIGTGGSGWELGTVKH